MDKKLIISRIDSLLEHINLVLSDYFVGNQTERTEVTLPYEIDKEFNDIVRMELNGNDFVFRDNSPWCFVNKRIFYMDDVCEITKGQVKLPLEFYKKIIDKENHFFRK